MLRSSLRTITLRSPRACSSRSSSTSSPSSSNEPPRPSYFTVETLYPFLLLSIITSLAVNLAYNRSVHAQESGALRAQISVLNKLNERLSVAAVASSSSSSSAQGASVKGKGRELLDEETIERELAMVGLGKAKLNEKGGIKEKVTSWREVFLGKRGKGFDDIAEEQIDWDEVVRLAEAPITRSDKIVARVEISEKSVEEKNDERKKSKPTLATFL